MQATTITLGIHAEFGSDENILFAEVKMRCLTPNARFRMRQVNIVGTSPPSQPSRKIQTLPAPPDMAPANVTLRTASETSLWLRWMVSLESASRVHTVSELSITSSIRGLF